LYSAIRATHLLILAGAQLGQFAGGLAANFAVACFTAGTPIVVDQAGNSKLIEELEVGDVVLARNEFDPAGPLELKRVEEKFVREAAVMELVVRGRSIKTTAEHPFFVPAQNRFVPAGELKAGDQLVSSTGELISIDSVSPLSELTTVYNLRVADFHTYFVGGKLWQFDAWVHNAGQIDYVGGANAPVSGPFADRLAKIAARTPEEIADRALRADALKLHRTFERGIARNGVTVTTAELDGKMLYSVSNNRTSLALRQKEEQLGYERVFGKKYTGPNQTHAEQIMLNYADDIGAQSGRLAPSRPACGPSRQNCAGRIDATPGMRLIGPRKSN
jgi:hypothetical protein